MKFTCERDAIQRAVNAAGRAGSGATVVQGLLLTLTGDSLTVTGSDLDVTIASDVAVRGDTDGTTVAPSRLLGDVVRSLEPCTLSISHDEETLHLRAGRSHFSLRTLLTEKFPTIPETPGTVTTVDGAAFLSGLRQVIPAASAEGQARPVLAGVLLVPVDGGLRLVTTDSYRLARRDIEGVTIDLAPKGILVPARALHEVTRLIGDDDDVEVQVSDDNARFSVGDTRLVARLIGGDFPSYEAIIPTDHPNRLTVDRTKLLDAIRRVRVMTRDQTPLTVEMTAGSVTLTAVSQDVGDATEHIDADYEGDDLKLAFKAEYFHDGVEAQTTDSIVLTTADAIQPALLRSATDDGYIYVLMPLRVNT